VVGMKTMTQSRISWFIFDNLRFMVHAGRGSQMKAGVAWTSVASNMSGTW